VLHFRQIITLPGLTRQRYNEFRDSFTGADRTNRVRDLSPGQLRQSAASLEPDIVDWLNCRIVIYIDGQRFGAHHIISAAGVDREGRKHIPSLEAGATENAAAGSNRRRH
jgi:hypothetical protein